MKTLAKLLIMLSAAAFVAFSCEQGPELEPPVVTPEDDEEVDDAPEAKPGLWDASAVTFSISAESPSTWAVGDVVKVFDDDFVRVEFTATDAENPASFTTSKSDIPYSSQRIEARSILVPPIPRAGVLMIRLRRRLSSGLAITQR